MPTASARPFVPVFANWFDAWPRATVTPWTVATFAVAALVCVFRVGVAVDCVEGADAIVDEVTDRAVVDVTVVGGTVVDTPT